MQTDVYRNLMKSHAGATVIIATGQPGRRTGLTATAFCSLSDSPPTILVCVNKNASAHAVIATTKSFSVNVLREDQADIAACFAGMTGLHGEERFQHGARWLKGETGAPVMADALVSLDCKLIKVHDHQTHSVFVGLVETGTTEDGFDPLIYFRGNFSSSHAHHSATCHES
jgi:flavin reductase (DIM6/NTAB) family NADH-FMN oxidoreductase RutF